MKKLLLLSVLLISTTLFSQAPEKMSYQALIRDASDVILQNQNVGIKISILKDSDTGSVVYSETHVTTTNVNGLVTLKIGEGTTTDDFSVIDWGNGSYFVKAETDPTGGTNYSIAGTSQLLSVPYALYAKSTGGVDTDANGVSDIQVPATNVVSGSNFVMHDSTVDKIYAYNGTTGVWTEQTTSEFFSSSSITSSNGNFIMHDSTADALYAYSSKTGQWSTQSTSEFFSSSSIVESNGNFIMHDSTLDKIYAFSGEAGIWSEQATSEFFSSSSFVESKGSFVMHDSTVDTLYAYSGSLGTWSTQSTSEFFSSSSIKKSNGFFVMHDSTNDILYAYSGIKGAWSTQATSEFFSSSSIMVSGN